jgi:hypothetical protein
MPTFVNLLRVAGWLLVLGPTLAARLSPVNRSFRTAQTVVKNSHDDPRSNEVTIGDGDDLTIGDCEDGIDDREGGKRDEECVEVQERECGLCHSIYLRECSIRMEYSYTPEKVEECTEYPGNSFSNNNYNSSAASVWECEQGYRRVCRTVYRSECDTQMEYRDMEEDHPVCSVEMTEDCSKKAAAGACQKVPVMRCRIEKRTVRKGQPETACRRVPEEICQKEKCAPPRRKCYERVRMSRELVPREQCGYKEKRVCQQTRESDCRTRTRQQCAPRYFVSRRRCKKARRQKTELAAPAGLVP